MIPQAVSFEPSVGRCLSGWFRSRLVELLLFVCRNCELETQCAVGCVGSVSARLPGFIQIVS